MKTKKLVMLLSVCAMSFFALTAYAEGNVAKIGNKEYETLDAAFDAAEDGVKTSVTLIGNITDSATITVLENKDVVLDLAGYTISTKEQYAGRHYYALDNYGTLTVKDSVGNGLVSARGMENFGTMTIESGNFETIDSNGGGACVWNQGDLTVTGGKFEFTGVKSGTNAATCITNAVSTAKTEITGGEFISKYICIAVNEGETTIKNITINRPEGSDEYFLTLKAVGGHLSVDNVTINVKSSGGIEVARSDGQPPATADITNCTINVTGENKQYGYMPACIAASNGATINVHGGTYTSDKYGLYVFNSGGTINVYGDTVVNAKDTALMASSNQTALYDSYINVYDGTFEGAVGLSNSYTKQLQIIAYGGKFSDTENLTLAPNKILTDNNEVIDGNNLTGATPFKEVGKDEISGHFFNVTKAADGKTQAIATFKDGEKTKQGILVLPNVDGSGNIEFSILLLGASKDVTGQIIYK